MLRLVLAAVVVTAFALAPHARAATWTAPVAGDVARPFTFDRTAPFAAGAHRGVDLVTRRGGPVAAPCSGRVTHAGPVPGHRRGVTIRCGALAATVLDLERLRVPRGTHVVRGRTLGFAAGATVHLGARRARDRHGYRDPLALLAPASPAPGPLPPAGPRSRSPREVPPPPAPAPLATPAPRVVPSPVAPSPATARPADPPGRVPLVAWAGLALLAAGLPAGALVRRGRARAAGRGRVAARAAQ